MRKVVFAAAIALLSTAAFAQTPAPKSDTKAPAKAAAPAAAPAAPAAPSAMSGMTCKAQAADKKLAGAAMNSFMKKCQTDASKSCAQESTTQNLKGAAKTSHMKKCVSDAVGT
jgi:psiF repeat